MEFSHIFGGMKVHQFLRFPAILVWKPVSSHGSQGSSDSMGLAVPPIPVGEWDGMVPPVKASQEPQTKVTFLYNFSPYLVGISYIGLA